MPALLRHIASVHYAITATKVNRPQRWIGRDPTTQGSTMRKNTSPAVPSRDAWTRQQPAVGKINPVPHSSVFGMYQVEPPWSSGPNVSRALVPSVVFAPILKAPRPAIRQTILVSVLALIGSGAKTSAQR